MGEAGLKQHTKNSRRPSTTVCPPAGNRRGPSRRAGAVLTLPRASGDIAPRYETVTIGVAWVVRKDAVPDGRRNGGDIVVVDRAIAIRVACHARCDERHEAIRTINGGLARHRDLIEHGDVGAGE